MSPRAERQRWQQAEDRFDRRLVELRDEFWASIDNDIDEQSMTDERIYGDE